MEVWKIIFLSKSLISRFHVNLPGCKPPTNHWEQSHNMPPERFIVSAGTLVISRSRDFSRWIPAKCKITCLLFLRLEGWVLELFQKRTVLGEHIHIHIYMCVYAPFIGSSHFHGFKTESHLQEKSRLRQRFPCDLLVGQPCLATFWGLACLHLPIFPSTHQASSKLKSEKIAKLQQQEMSMKEDMLALEDHKHMLEDQNQMLQEKVERTARLCGIPRMDSIVCGFSWVGGFGWFSYIYIYIYVCGYTHIYIYIYTKMAVFLLFSVSGLFVAVREHLQRANFLVEIMMFSQDFRIEEWN